MTLLFMPVLPLLVVLSFLVLLVLMVGRKVAGRLLMGGEVALEAGEGIGNVSSSYLAADVSCLRPVFDYHRNHGLRTVSLRQSSTQ